MLFLYLIIIPFLIISSGCQGDRIDAYRIPKSSSAEKNSAPPVRGADSAPLKWVAPSHWLAQPRTEMRLGSFLIRGQNGQTAEMSIIPLAGEAGGNLANINRWRQQIDLPPLTEPALKKEAKIISVADRRMVYVNFVSNKPLVDNKFRKRVVATIYIHGGISWFFKLMGDDQTVQSSERDFIQFLKTLEFASRE